MQKNWMTENEELTLKKSMDKLVDVLYFLRKTKNINELTDVYDTFNRYKKFKEKISNYNSDMAYISCLMAKEWLIKRFGSKIKDVLDVSRKSQSTKGFDIDINVDNCRIIAEIKNTVPCKKDGSFGAQQIKSIDNDLHKLRNRKAKHKFFFITNLRSYEILNSEKYKHKNKGIELVLLSKQK